MSHNNFLNKLLCHKQNTHYDHCFKLRICSRPVFICARCLGLYPVAILNLFLSHKYKINFTYSAEKNLIFYSMIPLVMDWSLTALGIIKSHNVIRFSTGVIAAFGLSRWWYLYLTDQYMDIFWYIARTFGVFTGVILVILLIRGGLR
ncbi:MAG: DUF2085 domain-containing protein [Spirochaetes bacterium]|nr:DUF2085 domain-containing protein [Spirochaetota bacterium]